MEWKKRKKVELLLLLFCWFVRHLNQLLGIRWWTRINRRYRVSGLICLVVLDTEIVNLMVTIIVPAVTGAVTVTVFLMKWRYGRDRHHQTAYENPTLNDIAREITDYIHCIRGMKEHYSAKFMEDSTSEQDKIFYKRLIVELDYNLDRNQRQLNEIIERVTRGR